LTKDQRNWLTPWQGGFSVQKTNLPTNRVSWLAKSPFGNEVTRRVTSLQRVTKYQKLALFFFL